MRGLTRGRDLFGLGSLRGGVVLALSGVFILSGMAISGCSTSSSGRSVDAYCMTFYEKGTQFRNEYLKVDANESNDPLGALVALITAPSQLADFFGDLAEVAPPSIEPQVAQIQAAFQKEVNGATGDLTNPIGGIINGLASAIETGPAWSAVNSWTDSNCGPPPGTKWLNGSQGS